MIIPIFKTLHIISVMIWMGVLLYMPRLFVYQLEASSKPEPDRSVLINQYKKMAKKLWIKVGWPAAILTIIFGMGMMHHYFSSVWFWVKMGFVAALLGHHHVIHFANKALQNDKYTKTVKQYNSMILTAAVYILFITILAVFKAALDTPLIITGVVIAVVLVIIFVVPLFRKSSKEKSNE